MDPRFPRPSETLITNGHRCINHRLPGCRPFPRHSHGPRGLAYGLAPAAARKRPRESQSGATDCMRPICTYESAYHLRVFDPVSRERKSRVKYRARVPVRYAAPGGPRCRVHGPRSTDQAKIRKRYHGHSPSWCQEPCACHAAALHDAWATGTVCCKVRVRSGSITVGGAALES